MEASMLCVDEYTGETPVPQRIHRRDAGATINAGATILVLSIALSLCGGCASALSGNEASFGPRFVVVDEGKPVASIVIAESPTKNARTAATELQHYVRRISGATLALTSDANIPAGPCILVGRS